ncbi:MAG: FHA domain-containing protein, partial [Chloroflexota bacterium]
DITDQQLAFTPQDAPTAEINIAAPVEPVTSDVPVSASGKRRSSERAALIPEILPTLTLIEENGRDVHREVPMYTEQFTIGRNRERDCVIESRHVSRLHATLRWNGDAFEIEDNDSQNGVYVDNEPIPPRSPVVLRPGLLYVIHLSRHADEPTSLTFIYEDNRPISFEGA